MNSKYINRFSVLPVLLVGLIFLASGILLYNYNNKIISKGKEINAIVQKIDKYKITLTYMDNDKTKNITYTAFFNKEKVSDNVKLYCKDNICKTSHSLELSYIFMLGGLIVFILSLISFLKVNIKYRKYTKVSSNKGIKIDARIVGIEVDSSIEENHVNPYYVICNAVNPVTNKEENYRSENIWFDARKIIEENNITTLPVYIDENNSNNYYVDISKLNIKSIRSR